MRPDHMTYLGLAGVGGIFCPPARRRIPLLDWANAEWQRLVVRPLLAVDRAGVMPVGSSSNGPTPVAPELENPADIHALDPAVQLQYLVENYSDAVYRVARSVVRDNGLAEDVSQEALLKAWQALPTFRGDAPLRNWVLRITHNTAVSLLRTRRDEVRDPSLLPEGAIGGTVEKSIEGRFAISAFEDALGELDELSRSIVVLRELENMSYDEIAEVLDVPLPTVKTRLLRARRVLSVALEEWRP